MDKGEQSTMLNKTNNPELFPSINSSKQYVNPQVKIEVIKGEFQKGRLGLLFKHVSISGNLANRK